MLSSTSALAHLRLGVALTHAEALAELVSDAQGGELQLFYFTSGTYSETALAYAERFGIALFTYDRAGTVSHTNAAAMTAILAAPDAATAPNRAVATRPTAPTGAEPSLTAAPEPDLQAWAVRAWRARTVTGPGPAFLAYLPLALSLIVGLLVGLLALPVVHAWQTGAALTIRTESVVVPVVVFHAFCVWGALRVARWRARVRRHRLDVMEACTLPRCARGLVQAAMQQSGRGVPDDREAFVLLRNEVMARSGVDAFTAGVLVWEVTIGAARAADRCEWIGAPASGPRSAY